MEAYDSVWTTGSKLNASTHRLPRVEESLTPLGQAKFFSTLDREKTVFIMSSGLLEFNRFPALNGEMSKGL